MCARDRISLRCLDWPWILGLKRSSCLKLSSSHGYKLIPLYLAYWRSYLSWEWKEVDYSTIMLRYYFSHNWIKMVQQSLLLKSGNDKNSVRSADQFSITLLHISGKNIILKVKKFQKFILLKFWGFQSAFPKV